MSFADAPQAPPIASLLRDNRFAAITSAAFALHDVRLRWLKGSERLGEPFRYEAKIASRDPIRNFARVPGQEITVGFKLQDDGTRFLHGIVTRLEYLGLDETRQPHYAVEIRPWLAGLAHRRNSRIFQNKTSLQIVTTIFREHRGGFKDRTNGRLPRREYCVQYDETDLDFVTRLMQQDGIYYYFEHAEGRHDLVLVDTVASHPAASPDTVETHLNLKDFRYLDDIIWHWREAVDLVPFKVVLDDYDEGKPAAQLMALAPVAPVATGGIPTLSSTSATPSRRGGGGRIGTTEAHTMPGSGMLLSEVYTYPGGYQERRDGDFYATIRAEEIACRAYRVQLEGSARQVTTGSVFKAANPFDIADKAMAPAPTERFLAIATEIEVIGDLGEGSGHDDSAPQLYRSTIEAMPAITQFRPPRSMPSPMAGGPQTAIVVGRPGESITTDVLGRIKVQFFWDREGRRDDNSSCWIRVAQSWAGSGFGGLVTPRVGQEVVVNFLHGDYDQPLVVGAVYNGNNPPPENLPDHATRSSFHTRTDDGGTRGYNQLRFEDRAGAEHVFLRAQRNHSVDVERLLSLQSGVSAIVSAREAVMLESASVPGTSYGSHIEVTPQGIALRVTAPGREQCILIGAEGITVQGHDIRLISFGKLLVSPIPIPHPPQLLPAVLAAIKRMSLLVQRRRTSEIQEQLRDQQ
ncbi:type VI secretion system Vgr family protein [Roseomonas marmotae]|uniref:Type VI secretion system tip protein VgrG n=1 Tax=Roseomonas marmotae TaxID=2768161 RepID=A0ABS3K8C1_9PROT|nr:type VI secretion system tip protein TssI/VgrG [Roseomonas marmotae]MBO1073707.1 type VI secretion system tip protein VgrG [Roseomonas marmotae]QTI78654.1 type VI secretion system tip protein VgrG [Roseomonas marmotae]